MTRRWTPLEHPRWSNARALNGNVVDEVAQLKHELAGEIVVYASYQLARTLIEHDLVDELRLVVFPVVLGAGERLFGETSAPKPVRLVDTRRIGGGLVSLTYELDRATSGSAGVAGAGRVTGETQPGPPLRQ